MSTPEELPTGGKTGWPPGMLQDDCIGLSKALSAKPNAKHEAREAALEIAQATITQLRTELEASRLECERLRVDAERHLWLLELAARQAATDAAMKKDRT